MSRITIPTREEFLVLAHVRADICVSVYLEASPMQRNAKACRTELDNLIKEALTRLENAGHDKRRLAALRDILDDAAGDDAFREYRANTLVILATPDKSRLYRLPNRLATRVEVSDRFYLEPLLRSLTFRHTAYVLALSENRARVVELHPEADPEEVRLADMPSSFTPLVEDRGAAPERRDEKKSRLARYARNVDEAMRPLTRYCDYPVILVAAEPLASLYRSVSASCLTADTVFTNPDSLSVIELAELARPALDAHYAADLEDVKRRFEERAGQHRVATDLADIARAATYGMVSLALVDFERTETGHINDDGRLVFSNDPEAYGVIDEIAKRVLDNSGRVLAVREEDMIGDTGVAAILRYPLHA